MNGEASFPIRVRDRSDVYLTPFRYIRVHSASTPIRPGVSLIAVMIPTDPLSTSRSLRCFVCGKTRAHRLSYTSCPRTIELIQKKLAAYTLEGRLVCYDGSPLPMTRRRGGVAEHLLASYNPTPSPSTLPSKSQRFPHLERADSKREYKPPQVDLHNPASSTLNDLHPRIERVPRESPHILPRPPEPRSHLPSHFTERTPPSSQQFPNSTVIAIFDLLVSSSELRRALYGLIESIHRCELERGMSSLAEYLTPVRTHIAHFRPRASCP
ncbi:hypothetical protein R3P38DRAFT_3483220 [Favolaschia claudopus]|uniref:Uncharacterized protein n=1 Tax=Favolaschia claudopus TaxID=2862362 RepID=A0AAV9Z7F9_9AGAR